MRRNSWFAILLVLLPAIASAGPVRVAVMSDPKDPSAAIIEASLAGDAKLALVDRSQLTKVLADQKLSLTGAVSPDQAVTVGRLVNADVLVCLDSIPAEAGRKALAVVAFDAHNGVRLRDRLIAEPTEEASASLGAAVVQGAVAKAGGAAGQRTLCLLSARNADLPRAMNGMVDAAGAMVERNLTEAPAFTILERGRLDKITAERNLPTAKPADVKLLASVNLVELQVGRSGGADGEVRIVALITDTAGQSIGRVEATSKPDAPAIAAAITPAILKTLGAAPAPVAGNAPAPAVEAARFLREGTLRAQHRDWPVAVRAMESAHALAPDDLAIQVCLAKTISGSFGDKHVNPHHKADQIAQRFAIVRRAMDNLLGVADKARKPGAQVPYETDDYRATVYWLCDWLAQRNYDQIDRRALEGRAGQWLELSPENMETFQGLMRDYRELRLERERAWAAAQVTDAASFDRYTRLIYQLRAEAENSYHQNDSAAYAADYRQLMMDWLAMVKKFQPEKTSMLSREFLQSDGGVQMDDAIRTALTTQRAGGDTPQRNRLVSLQITEARQAVYEAIAAHPDPWMGKYSRLASEFLAAQRAAQDNVIAATPRAIERRYPRELQGDSSNRPRPPEPKTPDYITPKGVWANARTLIDIFSADAGQQNLRGATVYDGAAYVTAISGLADANVGYELLRFPLDGGAMSVVGKVQTDNPWQKYYQKPDPDSPMHRLWAFGYQNACTISGGYYVLTNGPTAAPILFALDGRAAPRVLAKEPGWPAEGVQAVVVLDGKLYAAVGELGQDGFLIEQDLKGGAPKVLAASRRKEKLSPFDDQSPLIVPTMITDPARKRVVFYATSQNWDPGRAGLYEYSVITGKFRQIAADPAKPVAGKEIDLWRSAAFTPVYHDRFAVVGRMNAIVDLTTDKLSSIPPIRSDAPATAVGEGVLWRGMSRTKGDGKPTQFPSVRPDLGDRQVWPISLELIDDQRLLVGDTRGLWVVTPPDTYKPPANALAEGSIAPPPAGGDLPWYRVRAVYDYSDSGAEFTCVFRPIWRDGSIFAVGVNERGEHTLIKVEPATGTATKLGTNTGRGFKRDKSKPLAVEQYPGFAAMIDSAYALVPPDGKSIMFLPMDGSRGTTIKPASPITAMDELGNTLYLVVSDKSATRLIAQPPTGDSLELISSTSTGKRSSLDGVNGLRIPFVIADPARGRVLFVAHATTSNPDVDGVYSLTVAGGAVRRILPLFIAPKPPDEPNSKRYCEVQSARRQDDTLLLGTQRGLVAIDLKTDSPRMLSQAPDLPEVLDPQGKRLPVPDSTNDLMNGRIEHYLAHADMLLYKNWLWGVNTRISLDGREYDTFPPVRRVGNLTAYPYEWQSFSHDGKTLYMADQQTLWAFDLK